MPQQRVKPERYVAKAVIALADIGDEVFEAIMLPANAEVMRVNVEVIEAAAAGKTLDVGLGKENERFLNDIDITVANTNFDSSVVTMTNDVCAVTLQTNSASAKGKIVLRVDYALPTEIMTEF